MTDTKSSNASHLFFVNFNNNIAYGASFFIFCLTLPVRVSTVSLLVRLFVSMSFSPFSILFFFFLHKFLLVYVSVSLFVCLFGCYSAPLIIFGKCLDCYCQFRCCDTTVIFINHHPSLFFLFFHLSIGGEFKTFSSSGMVYSYPFVVWVSRLR